MRIVGEVRYAVGATYPWSKGSRRRGTLHFLLCRDAVPQARRHFIAWYSAHGLPWLERHATLPADCVGVMPRDIEMRDLGYRWGSCVHSGSLHSHWRVILLPPSIIEYIVAHELVHLREPHHDPASWQQLRRAVPDYAAGKEWLAEHGGRHAL